MNETSERENIFEDALYSEDEAAEFNSEAQAGQSGGEEDANFTRRDFAEAAERGMRAFTAAYPDVEELPDEVVSRIITTDQSPVEAYQGYLIELKDLEIAKLKQQQLNRANTPGSALGTPPAFSDAFLSEFAAD